MKYYVEVTLLPDVDIAAGFLWGKLYQQLHLALVEGKNAEGLVEVGAAFPRYSEGDKRGLGSKLRLFAQTSADLEALNLSHWLERLTDYVHVTSIREVPVNKVTGYACFKRLNVKGSPEKLAKRRAEKLGVPFEEALSFFQDKTRRLPEKNPEHYPFINIHSLSNGHRYCLTVEKVDMPEAVFSGGFSAYGLSSEKNISTVPLF